MNPTVAQFRTDFPEFADPSTYPDSLITLWLGVAANQVNPERWGTLATIGQELCAAHWIVIAARDEATSQAGGIPGTVRGLQTAKAVGDVSASFDVASVLAADAGFWNQTTYGVRYWSLLRVMGAGGVQLLFCS